MTRFTVSNSCKALMFFSAMLGVVANAYAAPDESDMLKIDGSSTVYPITEATAEEFGKLNRKVKVTVGISGTGGGFKKFCSGETDMSNASRPIKEQEIELCRANGVEYVELPVAYDALSVVVHPSNTWAKSITVAELKKIWEPEAQGKIMRWNQVRAEWPDTPLALFGAGVDSGTYDYFTEAVVGKEHSSRGDFTSSEDDNVLVQGVANNPNALGFFGLAYYVENQERVKAVLVDGGAGGKAPTLENVMAGEYQPLARPLFVYVRTTSLERPMMKKFISYYLENMREYSEEVGYVPLSEDVVQLAKQRLGSLKTGSLFAGGGSTVGVRLAEALVK